MSIAFNIEEVFALAIEVERYGSRFYRRAAEVAPDEDARRLLLDLAGYEDRHEATFRALKAQVAGRQGETPLDGDGVVVRYLQAMANGLVFERDGDPSARLSGVETLEEILHLALEMEQSSIAFYAGLQRAMPEPWGPEKVEAILLEEMSHVVFIRKELATRHGVAR